MNTSELTIVATPTPEILEQIFYVIRQQKFNVIKMQMKLENNKIWCDLSVQSDQAIELLIQQLIGLPEIIDVTADDEDSF